MSSTVREEGRAPIDFLELVMSMQAMPMFQLPLTSVDDFVAGMAELAVWIL